VVALQNAAFFFIFKVGKPAGDVRQKHSHSGSNDGENVPRVLETRRHRNDPSSIQMLEMCELARNVGPPLRLAERFRISLLSPGKKKGPY
jgi:hypothetical protein